MSILSNPYGFCESSSRVATVKLAKIADIVFPILPGEPGTGLFARLTIPAPPVAVSATKLRIAEPPPSFDAR